MERVGRQTPTFTNVSGIEHISNTKGEDAANLYAETGQHLVEWQKIQLNAIMEMQPDGLWKNMTYGLSVSRRNGKGEVLSARELYGIVMLGEKVCHTAHRTTTSHDAFTRLYRLLKKAGYEEHSRKAKVMSENSFFASKQFGLEHIEIVGHGEIDFRTRSDNGGLGEGFDLLVIDEAQEYTAKQESALIYTVSASQNPQTIMTGTPPTAVSHGDVFRKIRDSVMTGKAQDTGWSEWSVEKLTKDIENIDLWYECNPSLGTVLRERNIRSELSVGEVDFNIQRLGLWLEYARRSEISAAEWNALKCDKLPDLYDRYYFGVKFGKDGVNNALSVAVKTSDGKIFVETMDCRPAREGCGWMLEYFANAKTEAVAIDGANGQRILADAMTEHDFIAPILPKVAEVITANALFEQAVAQQTICHMGQPSLAESVSNCEKRAIGSNGGFGFRSISENHDIVIMESAVLAHWLASTAKEDVEPQTIDY